jgi:hypothetical protein
MHQRDRRQLEVAALGSPSRHALAPEHPLLSLQRTAGNAAVSRLVQGAAVQRQEYPEPVPGAGGGAPGAVTAGVVNVMGGVVNVMGGVVNVAGGAAPETGGAPSSGGGGGGWGEEVIPVPTTGGV